MNKMNWQPIETAPKDGTDLLLFYPSSDGEAPFIDVNRWLDWPREMNAYSWTTGGVNPTHWMPMPEPPKDE